MHSCFKTDSTGGLPLLTTGDLVGNTGDDSSSDIKALLNSAAASGLKTSLIISKDEIRDNSHRNNPLSFSIPTN